MKEKAPIREKLTASVRIAKNVTGVAWNVAFENRVASVLLPVYAAIAGLYTVSPPREGIAAIIIIDSLVALSTPVILVLNSVEKGFRKSDSSQSKNPPIRS